MREDSRETHTTVDRRQRRHRLEKDEDRCSRCPPHDSENRSRRPRPDSYKSRRKGR